MHSYTYCMHKVIFNTTRSVSLRISKDTLEKIGNKGKLRHNSISSSLRMRLYCARVNALNVKGG